MTTPRDPRARALAALHAEAKRLGMDEDTRRDLIADVSAGRTRSARDLTLPELRAVLHRLGGAKSRRARVPKVQPGEMLAKIRAQLTDAQLPWTYAEAILRRQRGLPAGIACPLDRATDAELLGVIAALHRRARRAASTPEPAA